MMLKFDVTYQFSIPQHIRGQCHRDCPFWMEVEDEDGRRPNCVVDLDEAVCGGELIPGKNCIPGTYVCRRAP